MKISLQLTGQMMNQDTPFGANLIHQLNEEIMGQSNDEVHIEALYRFICAYNLYKSAPSISDVITSWVGDAIWSVRKARKNGLKAGIFAFRAMRYLRLSAFDEAFYRLQLDTTIWAKMPPVRHYVLFGVSENFDPAPGFNTAFYLSAHQDVMKAGVNPFEHYLKSGRIEHRRAEPSRRIADFIQMLKNKTPAETTKNLGIASTLETFLTPSIEENDHHPWPRQNNPKAALTLYDIRPDDGVIVEANAGEAFLEKWKLLSDSPMWQAAIEALNALPLPNSVSSDFPKVSIIVPVYGQLAYTLNCLDSLFRHTSKYSFEIIVGDDASLDKTSEFLSKISGIIYKRHNQNNGFITNCNETARLAKGSYIVMLNNDTRVCEGWLNALIDSFSLFTNTGLAGSKLYYPDGALQEAGGIVWQDGSAWNYGRNDDPNRPRYCYAREVDYISGAAIAIERSLWDSLSGFDELYKPAYYEDTDLAFRIREAGQKVIMQPLSRVIHYEGKTSGTDLATGAKAYQITNGAKFYKRWASTLLAHRPNAESPWLEKERNKERRVLILDATTPTRFTDAGSMATFALIDQYQAMGFKVTFVPEDNFLYLPADTEFMQSIGVECLYAPYDLPMSVILQRYGQLFDIINVIRPEVSGRNLELIRRCAPQAKLIYLNADLHYLRMERQATVEKNLELLDQSVEMKALELHLAQSVDVNLVHSQAEKALLEAEGIKQKIVYYPLTETVSLPKAKSVGRKDFMFLGGYNHTPNVDAALWLLEEIWPALHQACPDARLLLVGAKPPASLQSRANDNVIVTGLVDDLEPWFAKTRVFIAPLRYGAGAKGKVLSAMCHGVPVVATDIAAEGMPFTPDINIHVANSAEDIISEALRLHALTTAQWQKASRAAQTYIDTNHRFEAGLNALKTALQDDVTS